MKFMFRILASILIAVTIFACSDSKKDKNISLDLCEGFVEDASKFCDSRDGKKYAYKAIGNQIWMAENLNYDAPGSKCYDNKQENCAKYGKLYDWETAIKSCPDGWNLPSDWEWQVLVKFAEDKERSISGEKVAGEKLKAKNGWKEDAGWKEDENSNYGMDSYGFSALPGGYVIYSGLPGHQDLYDSNFYGAGTLGYWWAKTSGDDDTDSIAAWSRKIYYTEKYVQRRQTFKTAFLSVRCLKFALESNEQQKDWHAAAFTYEQLQDERDGKEYKTVQIGNQTWMAENLNYATEGSMCFYDCKYGRFYNKEAAMIACPKGWRLPSDNEWNILIATVGGKNIAGRKLKAKSGWEHYGDGTDDYGFSALPGGFASSNGVNVASGFGNLGKWWSSTEDHNSKEWYWKMYADDDLDRASSEDNNKTFSLYSVRCVHTTAQTFQQKKTLEQNPF
jgi:uncharacterized protein (TIGR02145 family)